jgi:hypothetical protein
MSKIIGASKPEGFINEQKNERLAMEVEVSRVT